MSSESANADSFVLFELAGTTYGVRSADVRQLEMIEHITPVPNASGTLEGVVFSRGRVIPAMSLRARFGFPKVPHDIRSRLIVVEVGDRVIGLIVDSAREFKIIPNESLSAPPDGLAELSGHYLNAVANLGESNVLILDLAEVIKTDDIEASAAEG